MPQSELEIFSIFANFLRPLRLLEKVLVWLKKLILSKNHQLVKLKVFLIGESLFS